LQTARPALNFDVHGYRFSLRGTPEEAVESVSQDFALFAAPAVTANVTLELFDQHPPQEGLPDADAVVYTPRNLVYRNGTRRYLDYHGRAMGIREEGIGNLKPYSRDPNLLCEAAYLYPLSQICRHLDRCGLHRIHARGVVIRNRAVLVSLPIGGGTSGSRNCAPLIRWSRVRRVHLSTDTDLNARTVLDYAARMKD
jgi:hypothetical protein